MTDEESIEEMMRQVRRLEIRARRLASETFSGDYHSSFKGAGLDFDEFREYQPGDEIRFIDWNVTARMQETYIRKFREERELSVVIVVDVSGSTDFGSDRLSKRERAAELTALMGFSARYNGDKVGLLLFSKGPELYLPPRKGGKTVIRAIREVLSAQPEDPQTSVTSACEFLHQTLKRKSLIFFISDFIDWGFEKTLGSLAQQHDVVALSLTDPLEEDIPAVGKVQFRDPETGFTTVVNTSNPNARMGLVKLSRRYREGLADFFKKRGIDHAVISTTENYLPSLHQLFQRRARRKN
ncbi:DUF58 domain-containing protein [Akkermansiaceae bacterium]|nr:DUF58 domain-containing protein [Akkermansiaceae bacterium]MDB0056598.1 DUF58 domain-containing protein [Akkermansiaceae bacterium]MDB4258087.1 DUF58 domain-containing protein [Akkermansiaceae bacterium]MDB4321494.1 DUF58 domain-containing protein [Akkermansiaceae bacterium]MDB4540853.1 DUF58 domain-containing protein [Akkermansiaceae bacterium]